MRDVADHAGVSLSTVSYILSGRRSGSDRISAETRQRVLSSVERLGYVPNRNARVLRRQLSERICLALPRLGVPGYDPLAQALLQAASAHHYSLVITITTPPNDELSVLQQVRGGLADGLVLLLEEDKRQQLAEPLDEAARGGTAVVVLNNQISSAFVDVVHTTEAQAAYEAVEYLILAGRRRIGLITFNRDGTRVGDRHQAYLAALTDYGIPIDEALIQTGADSRQAAYDSARALLTRADPPDAIFALADIAAISAMHAAREMGLCVPDDVAVIGTGNIPEGETTSPALTTIGATTRAYHDVADLLFRRLRGEAPAAGQILLREWVLHQRESA